MLLMGRVGGVEQVCKLQIVTPMGYGPKSLSMTLVLQSLGKLGQVYVNGTWPAAAVVPKYMG